MKIIIIMKMKEKKMISKRFEFTEDTISRIHAIKDAKGFKTEKEVIVNAIENYLLSEMIEHESEEYKMLKKMTDIEEELRTLKRKINYIDHGVTVNSLFLASEFEIEKYPKAIINRRTFDGFYHSEAKKEITKMIRERDEKNRISKNSIKKIEEKENRAEENKDNIELDKQDNKDRVDEIFGDDWLNI